jgi:hypothetical protein
MSEENANFTNRVLVKRIWQIYGGTLGTSFKSTGYFKWYSRRIGGKGVIKRIIRQANQ